jgi:protoporphyrinogen oxidase
MRLKPEGKSLQAELRALDMTSVRSECQAATAKPHVVILGGGPAGLGAAWRLALRGVARVTVLEAADRVGGNAGSFELQGMHVDYGSHRLHPATAPHILRDLKQLLGDDLLDRPRHGRIRLGGRWIHFPLKPLDLGLRLPKRFALGVAADMMRKILPRNRREPQTFATVLERGLGRTICREFYFPYARKLWGLAPQELAVMQAQRRISGSSLGKMVRKIAAQVPGLKPPGVGRFFYPRRGYGQISEQIAQAAQGAGADLRLGARVTAVEREDRRVTAVRVEQNGSEQRIEADMVWSTLPITMLVRGLRPQAPATVQAATGALGYRAMILIYLVLDQDRFSEYDAHYFPEEHIAISRMSEPKNYCAASEPRGRTVLCAELPCAAGDATWRMSDEALGQLLLQCLEQCGIPARAPVLGVATRRLRQAYPVYVRGYEEHFGKMDAFLESLEGLVNYGRQGLFAHDNTHHALYMAYGAVDCFREDGSFDRGKWTQYRKVFEEHVVED